MNPSSAIVSSSSSPPSPFSTIPVKEYDVFISFRGTDIRQSFTSHLYDALRKKYVCTFIDEKLRKGDPILTLFPIIENTKISIIVFSPDYASSKWCLNELVKILECRQTRGQVALPVFYNVKPDDVKDSTGSYGLLLAKHEVEQPQETIQKWRDVLKEACCLSGYSTADTSPDALLVKKIVKDIRKRLDHTSSDCIGIKSKIKEIESELCHESMDLRIVRIWGISGIGKTTLARATFDEVISKFGDDAHFVGNIKDKSESNENLSSIRDKIFSSESGGKGQSAGHSKKVIIVFDDVSDLMQIKSILGPFSNWSNTGSRFIITSNDGRVFQNLCHEGTMIKLDGLFGEDALELFSKYAFKRESPMKGYNELSKKAVGYTKYVPLALKVLGSFLNGKSKKVWKSEITKLEKKIEVRVQDVLHLSFDGLNDTQKKIFLDIGCLFQGERRDFLVKYFDVCGFDTEIELDVMIEKCLIPDADDEVRMHDSLQGMCREIVWQEFVDDPENLTNKLWRHKNIYQVFRSKTDIEAIEGVSLDMSIINFVNLRKTAFEKIRNLRLLEFYRSLYREKIENEEQIPQGVDSVLNKLIRYLQWDARPLSSLQPLQETGYCSSNSHCKKQDTPPHDLRGSEVAAEMVLPSDPKLIMKSPKCYNSAESKRVVGLPNKSLTEFKASRTVACLSACKYLLPCGGKLNCLPSSFCKLESLADPDIHLITRSMFKEPNELLHDLGNLGAFQILDASGTSIEEMLLSVSYLSSFSKSFSLEYLDRSRNKFGNRAASIINLSQLEFLILCCCDRRQTLTEIPLNLDKILDAAGCSSLKPSRHSSLLFPTFKHCYAKHTILMGRRKLEKISNRSVTKHGKPKPEATPVLHHHSNTIQGYCINDNKSAYVIYPGSEIPEGFSSQSVGSSITLELQLRSYNRTISGIAFCVVINLPCSCIGLNYKFEKEDGQFKDGECSLYINSGYPLLLEKNDGFHVCIGYVPFDKSLYQLQSATASFRFYVEKYDSLRKIVNCVKVEACGVRFLQGQNLRKRRRGNSHSIDNEQKFTDKKVRRCRDDDEGFNKCFPHLQLFTQSWNHITLHISRLIRLFSSICISEQSRTEERISRSR